MWLPGRGNPGSRWEPPLVMIFTDHTPRGAGADGPIRLTLWSRSDGATGSVTVTILRTDVRGLVEVLPDGSGELVLGHMDFTGGFARHNDIGGLAIQ